MTTTVKRGAGRPAATARRNRHAQTNPFPTQESVATATALRDPAAETPAEARTEYGRMTVPELRARLDTLTGGQAAKRLTKGQLLNYILEAEQKARGAADLEAAQAEQDQIPQSEDAPSGAYVPETADTDDLEPKGSAKARKLSVEIAPAGWETEVTGRVGRFVDFVATRGEETLRVSWDAGVFVYDLSGHAIADRTTKIRNVSHGRQLAARSPEDAAAELNRVGSNKAWRPREAKTSTPKSKLPFDVTHAVDAAVIAALAGKHIVWVNRISNLEEHAEASRETRQWRITGEAADRVIQFTTTTGFRACRLDKILRVGKPTRKRAVAEEAGEQASDLADAA